MPKTMTLTIPDETAAEFERFAQDEGWSPGGLFEAMLRAYRVQRRQERVRQLQRYGEKKARELGIKDEEDVYRLVQEFRQEERERREQGDTE